MFSNKLWQWANRLVLAAALLVGTMPAQAGWLPLAEPSSTPVSNACINVSGTTVTFTAQGVGGANPNRITVVSINWDDSTAAGTAELNTMTVGGISMSRASRATGDNQNSNSEIWYVANPSGTSANIVATFSTAVDGITIEVYSLIGYVTAPAAGTTGTTSVSQAYNNKQLAIASASRTVNVSTSLSNMVNDFSSACGASLWGVHASQTLRGNNQTLTSTISPTSNNPKIVVVVWSTSPASTTCTEATTFLARTSGLDTTHTTAYTNLICGLVVDGIWANLDVLYVFATQDSTTALLNLVSTSFTGVTNGSPAFAVDRGFTGVDASTTVFINTQFNPTTAPSPHFSQNTGHISAWSNTNAVAASNGGVMIGQITANSQTFIIPRRPSNVFACPVNSTSVTASTNTDSTGFYIGNRTSTSATQAYKNGSLFQSTSDAGGPLLNNAITVLALRDASAGPANGAGYQHCEASIGGALSAIDASNFNSRLRTYMTAVGVP